MLTFISIRGALAFVTVIIGQRRNKTGVAVAGVGQ